VLVEGYKKWRYPYIEIYNDLRHMESAVKERKNHLKIARETTTGSPIPTFKKNDLKNVLKFIESKMNG